MNTAKQVARNLLTDKYGHAVSDTKLKNFLKQDKDLKKFVYKSKTSTLTKHEAQKFFNKVVGTAKTSEGFKVSRMAKKMGIKDTTPQTTDIQLEKIYKHASQTEIDAMPHDTGPTPAELAKQARHEKALKTLHKRERADEIAQEKEAQAANTKADSEQKPSAAPPPLVGSSGIGTIGGPSGSTNTSGGGAPPAQTDKATTPLVQLLIFPVENQSPNIPGFELIVQKLNAFIRQHLISSRIIPIVPEQTVGDALRDLQLDTMPTSQDLEQCRALASRAKATLFLVSSISRIGQYTELTMTVHNTTNAHTFQLAHLREPIDDVFEFQRRLGWQIDAALQAQNNDQDTTTPSSTDAIELPI